MILKIHHFYISGVGSDFIGEASSRLFKRIAEIIEANNFSERVLYNSFPTCTNTCQIYIVCTDKTFQSIHHQLKDLFGADTVQAITTERPLSETDLRIFSTPGTARFRWVSPSPTILDAAERPVRYNERRCVCGQSSFVQWTSTDCTSCNRRLLARGVIQTTRNDEDDREYVFFNYDGSILGTNTPPVQIRHP